MAKNRKVEEENSGDEMEASSPENAVPESDSESGSETEPEQPPKKAAVAAPKKPPPQDSSSSEESDSDSESDRGAKKPNPVIKPISSKPMDDHPQKPAPAKKPKSKSNAAAKPTSPVKSATGAGAKRLADDGEAKESKRSKKKPEKEVENPVKEKPSEDVKRQLFQRLWSEEDEIAILKGMIDYVSKKKSDPVADLNAFHEFIKKSVHVDVTKTQLQDKIRRLKKKYENNAGKEKKGKKERTFSKPHEQKAYDLSKKIWGKDKTENGAENETVEKEESKTGCKDNGVLDEVTTTTTAATRPLRYHKWGQVEVEEKTVEGSQSRLDLVSCGKSVAALEEWLKENSGLISMEKRIEMKKKITDLQIAQMDLQAKRIELIGEQYSLVREAMKTSRK